MRRIEVRARIFADIESTHRHFQCRKRNIAIFPTLHLHHPGAVVHLSRRYRALQQCHQRNLKWLKWLADSLVRWQCKIARPRPQLQPPARGLEDCCMKTPILSAGRRDKGCFVICGEVPDQIPSPALSRLSLPFNTSPPVCFVSWFISSETARTLGGGGSVNAIEDEQRCRSVTGSGSAPPSSRLSVYPGRAGSSRPFVRYPSVRPRQPRTCSRQPGWQRR